MKRLLVLTVLSVLAAGFTGCASCCPPRKTQPCRPCMQAPACCGGAESYSTPGVITTSPTLSVPQNFAPQVIPGPAAYVPAQ